MKHSLILHPPNSTYLRIDSWLLDVLGKKEHAAAAVLSQLEYWQRIQLEKFEDKRANDTWVKRGPTDFSKALHGLYAKDKIRAALTLLVEKGWVEEDEETVFIGQLWRKNKKFRLVLSAINTAAEQYSYLKSKESDFSASGEQKNRSPEAEKSPSRSRKIVLNTNSNTLTTNTTTPSLEGSGSVFNELPNHLQKKAWQATQNLNLDVQCDVVDELIGQISEGVAKYPERLLLTLVQAARDGTLTLDFAYKVRKKRAAIIRQVTAKETSSPFKNDADSAFMIEAGEAFFKKVRDKAASKNLT